MASRNPGRVARPALSSAGAPIGSLSPSLIRCRQLPRRDLAGRSLNEPDEPSLAIEHDLARHSAELETRMRGRDKGLGLGLSHRHRPRAPRLVPPSPWTGLSADVDQLRIPRETNDRHVAILRSLSRAVKAKFAEGALGARAIGSTRNQAAGEHFLARRTWTRRIRVICPKAFGADPRDRTRGHRRAWEQRRWSAAAPSRARRDHPGGCRSPSHPGRRPQPAGRPSWAMLRCATPAGITTISPALTATV